MAVVDADDKAHRISRRICDEVPQVREAFIHIEPGEVFPPELNQ
jgi:hypothetical protein